MRQEARRTGNLLERTSYGPLSNCAVTMRSLSFLIFVKLKALGSAVKVRVRVNQVEAGGIYSEGGRAQRLLSCERATMRWHHWADTCVVDFGWRQTRKRRLEAGVAAHRKACTREAAPQAC